MLDGATGEGNPHVAGGDPSAVAPASVTTRPTRCFRNAAAATQVQLPMDKRTHMGMGMVCGAH